MVYDFNHKYSGDQGVILRKYSNYETVDRFRATYFLRRFL